MGTKQYEQRDFGGGEIDVEFENRADIKSRARSLRSASNMKLLNSGASTVRDGTVYIDSLPGQPRIETLTVLGHVYRVVFYGGGLRIYDDATRTLIQTLSAVWAQNEVVTLVFAPYGAQLFIFHQLVPPQVLTRDPAAGVWSLATYVYDTGVAGTIRQPYYRFAPKGLVITPSATTGSITLTSSAPYFVAGMVGMRMRLSGREVLITAFNSSTSLTANVYQALFPTRSVQVVNASGYDVGETLQGTTSNATGELVAISGNTLTVLMTTFDDFSYVSGATPPGEPIVGENASSLLNAATSITSNAPILDITESVLFPFRGYPGTGVVHNNRLMMARFPGVPFGIAASAINAFGDFEVGTADDDSLFELIGDQDSGVIQSLHSAEQLLVMTSRHLLYCPESESFPLTPSNFTLLRIGPDGASGCRPVNISEGVVYAQTAGGSIIGAFPTGDVRRSWKTTDLSYMAAHLVKNPVALTYVSGSPLISERYVYIVNADASLTVMSYDESDLQTAPAFTTWPTQGSYADISAIDGECWVLVYRPALTPTMWTLEVFDSTQLLDCTMTPTLIGPGALSGFVYSAPMFAGATAAVLIGGTYVGDVVVAGDGSFPVPATPTGPVTIGLSFAPVCIPWAPLDAETELPQKRRRRISGAVVRYQGAAMSVNGVQRPLYDGGDDTSLAPPVRDETLRFPCFGWDYEPTVTVSRGAPAPWTLLGLTLEVSA